MMMKLAWLWHCIHLYLFGMAESVEQVIASRVNMLSEGTKILSKSGSTKCSVQPTEKILLVDHGLGPYAYILVSTNYWYVVLRSWLADSKQCTFEGILLVWQYALSVLPRLLLQGAAPCPLFVTPCPFEKAEMTPCPFD